MSAFTVLHYTTATGQDVFQDWLDDVRDLRARDAIRRRADRCRGGNFGDSKPCRDGVSELRIDVGPGYRVYYAVSGKTVVVLLCGGDKRRQQADIARAVEYWQDLQRRQK